MEWISVKERLPPENTRVLVYEKRGVHGGNPIDIEYMDESGDWEGQGIVSGITHWMPLPKEPENM
jgi:hypothetical protein